MPMMKTTAASMPYNRYIVRPLLFAGGIAQPGYRTVNRRAFQRFFTAPPYGRVHGTRLPDHGILPRPIRSDDEQLLVGHELAAPAGERRGRDRRGARDFQEAERQRQKHGYFQRRFGRRASAQQRRPFLRRRPDQ